MSIACRLVATVLLMAVAFPARGQAPQQVSDDTFSPVWQARDISRPCVARFNLTPEGVEARRLLMRQVTHAALAETKSWRGSYFFAGIDHADFRYFHIVGPDGCSAIGSVIQKHSQTPGLMRDAAGDAAGRVLIVDPKELESYSNPFRHIIYFVKTRSMETIRKCLVHLRIEDDLQLDSFGLWEKYDQPLREVTGSFFAFDFIHYSVQRRGYFLILSSHCAQRERIMESFRQEVVARYPGISASSLAFDYSGDAYEYLRENLPNVVR